MNQTERRALVRGLERVYPQFIVQEVFGGIRIDYVTPFDGVNPLRKRARSVWIQDTTWDATVEQASAFARSWGFLPVEPPPPLI